MKVQRAIGINLYSFFNLYPRWGWFVNTTPGQYLILDRDPVPVVQEPEKDPEACLEQCGKSPFTWFHPWTVHPLAIINNGCAILARFLMIDEIYIGVLYYRKYMVTMVPELSRSSEMKFTVTVTWPVCSFHRSSRVL